MTARAIAPSFARVVAESRSADRGQQLLEDLQHDRLASWLGADQRAHHQGDVQGRGVHDVESGGHGAAGRHRRAPRRRALHRGVARALPTAARSGEGGAVGAFPECRCRIRKAPSTRFQNSTTSPIAPHLRPRWCARPASRWRPASDSAVMAKATSAYVLHPPKPRSAKRSTRLEKFLMTNRGSNSNRAVAKSVDLVPAPPPGIRTTQYEVVNPRDLRRGQCALVPDLHVRWRAALWSSARLTWDHAAVAVVYATCGGVLAARGIARGEPRRASPFQSGSRLVRHLPGVLQSARSVPASLHISTSCLK